MSARSPFCRSDSSRSVFFARIKLLQCVTIRGTHLGSARLLLKCSKLGRKRHRRSRCRNRRRTMQSTLHCLPVRAPWQQRCSHSGQKAPSPLVVRTLLGRHSIMHRYGTFENPVPRCYCQSKITGHTAMLAQTKKVKNSQPYSSAR